MTGTTREPARASGCMYETGTRGGSLYEGADTSCVRLFHFICAVFAAKLMNDVTYRDIDDTMRRHVA